MSKKAVNAADFTFSSKEEEFRNWHIGCVIAEEFVLVDQIYLQLLDNPSYFLYIWANLFIGKEDTLPKMPLHKKIPWQERHRHVKGTINVQKASLYDILVAKGNLRSLIKLAHGFSIASPTNAYTWRTFLPLTERTETLTNFLVFEQTCF